MIDLACSIPPSITLAISGGVDSMSLLDFAIQGRRKVKVIHIDHGTAHAKEARAFVESYCKQINVPCDVHTFPALYDGLDVPEEVWREFRLGVYKQYTSKGEYLATGHHADDNLEWAIMSFVHGNIGKFMKPVDEEHKLLKPFLFTDKEELVSWCERKSVPYITDPTNIGTDNVRARLRSKVIPELLAIHPGMKSSIKNRAMRNV